MGGLSVLMSVVKSIGGALGDTVCVVCKIVVSICCLMVVLLCAWR